MSKTLSEIATAIGGIIEGCTDTLITGVAGMDDAAEGDIIFIDQERFAAQAAATPAAAILARPGVDVPGKTVVRVAEPRLAFAHVLELMEQVPAATPGVAQTARLGENVTIGAGVSVGDFCSLGDGVTLGDGVVLMPFVCLGDNVTIGPNTILFPHVTVYRNVRIGARVRIHANSVIGADGFGYLPANGQHRKIPHLGTVVIEDDVELGACVCVDRAKTGETRVGHGTKVDNLVQIAHNVQIGPNCIIVAQVGIAGSAILGENVIVAGQVGVGQHTEIGAGARIGGQSGVSGRVEPGSTVSGLPARDHRENLRILAATQHLPGLVQTVRELRKRIEDLESRLGEE